MTDVSFSYLLSAPQAKPFASTGTPLVYLKDVIRTGNFFVPQAKTWLNVTPERIDKWVANFARMQQAGVGVSFTTDHQRTADAKRGNISRLYRDGDTAVFEFSPPDAETETMIKRCPDVSLELEFDVKDGTGAVYDEAITAITATPDPVVPGQRPYQLIAASKNDNARIVRMSAIYQQNKDGTFPKRSNRMTPEHLTRMQSALGMKPDATEEETVSAALERLEKAKKDAADAKTETGDNKDQELKDAKDEADKTKKELARVLKLSKASGAPEIDPDALEAFSEARTAEVNALVAANKITPAVAKKLCASLIGEPGSRPAICLSTKAAAHAGLDGPIAKAVLEALKDNDPVLLHKLAGEKSGIQAVKLERTETGNQDKYDPKVTKEMADKAFAGR